MKNIICIALTCCIITACSKSATDAVQNNGLIGKWELKEYFISPGDAGAWHTAEKKHTVEFREDGSFTCSDSSYKNAMAYELVDSTHINLLLPTQIPSYDAYIFELKDDNQTLILSYIGCIEGCSNKYKAVKNPASKSGSD